MYTDNNNRKLVSQDLVFFLQFIFLRVIFIRIVWIRSHFSFSATVQAVKPCISKFPLVARASSALENIPAMGAFHTFLMPSISSLIIGPSESNLPAQLKRIRASASGISSVFSASQPLITFSIASKSGGREKRTLEPCGTGPPQYME